MGKLHESPNESYGDYRKSHPNPYQNYSDSSCDFACTVGRSSYANSYLNHYRLQVDHIHRGILNYTYDKYSEPYGEYILHSVRGNLSLIERY